MASEFFYRVFASVDKNLWANEIEEFLDGAELGLTATAVVDEDDADNLDAVPVELIFFDGEDREVFSLVYDDVQSSEFLAEEIQEFVDCVDEMAPERNREWVRNKLGNVCGCYCFSIFDAGFEDANWERLEAIAAWLREETDGIEQSDSGLITNEDGEVVLIAPDDEEEADESDAEDDVVEFTAALLEDDGAWRDVFIDDKSSLDKFLRGEA